ncbi:MAG TPA: pyridoxamine 5'-phosphate oxidase [Polyangiales bacterium]|nr:pyridoxamine 5'-phosphate oxidase [Polyangiales bacterium]
MTLEDPIARFAAEYERAGLTEAFDASRCALATADHDGRPDARFVLLKGFDEDGFVFYTNFQSAKGRDLEANPHAALVFHWHTTGIQVRIRGPVTKVSDAEADAYFAIRDRGSQLGAWASRQSSVLPSRESLEAAVAEAAQRFENVSVPRPPFWGGYRIAPTSIEFWQDRSDRLHDRWLYERDGGSWHVVRLYP